MEETKSIDGKRCLVTGGAGFLGRYLTQALVARGCEVHVLDITAESETPAGVRWFQGDIQNRQDVARACEGVEVVFHTVALIELTTLAPEAFIERVRNVNIEGTRTLLEIAKVSGVKRFVHTSSTNAVFGQETSGGDESGPYSTSRDLYSSTKAESERIVLEADTPGGMRTCALRPGGIYGPGERQNLTGPIVQALKKGLPVITFGKPRTLLDYTYIDNTIDAHLRAADRLVEGSSVCGQAYFVTDDSPINPGDFSVKLVENMEVPHRVFRLPPPIARGIAAISERAFARFGKPKPQVTRVSVDLCTQDNYFSIDKARRDLGYEPRIDTEEGLRRTALDARSYYDSLG